MAVLFIAGLSSLLCAVFLGLPMIIAQQVDGEVLRATLIGDMPHLPAYWPYLRYFLMVLSSAGACMAMLLFLWPMLFHWGGITAINQMRQQEMTEN